MGIRKIQAIEQKVSGKVLGSPEVWRDVRLPGLKEVIRGKVKNDEDCREKYLPGVFPPLL